MDDKNSHITLNQGIAKIEFAQETFIGIRQNNAKVKFKKEIIKVSKILRENKKEYGRIITEEMNKPITQSISEVEKCAWLCDYYAENAEEFLEDREYETEEFKAYIKYEPLGVLLGIMPWNFPFWQVFRFAIPNILIGNTIVLKHASNVPKSAKAIEEIFLNVNLPKGVYQNLPLSSKDVQAAIKHPFIKGVSLTGSEKAGSQVASQAGKLIKKSLLELGGSNAFIVLEDADLENVLPIAVNARMQNSGQSCIATKRFFVHESKYDDFLKGFKKLISELNIGNPMDESTQIGPLARVDLAQELESQVNKSVEMGAKIEMGGKRKDAFYEPTILTEVTSKMPVAQEETFGPVAVIRKFKTIEEVIELSNETEFGLGVSVFTRNPNQLNSYLHLLEEGAVFINEMVKSDPRLPFGGIKKSGYGRELSVEGMREFVNVKTIFINSK